VAVERGFSFVNLTQTKFRSKILPSKLDMVMTVAKNMPTAEEVMNSEERERELVLESDEQINVDDECYVTLKQRELEKKAEEVSDAKDAGGKIVKALNKYTVHTPIPSGVLNFCLALLAGGSQGLWMYACVCMPDCI
jgi:hypothetical protein